MMQKVCVKLCKDAQTSAKLLEIEQSCIKFSKVVLNHAKVDKVAQIF